MTVLGTWAVGNIALGSILSAQREGEDKYFHQMNALWNGVNLTLAGVSFYTLSKQDPASFGLYESMQESRKLQNILLFNTGLDVGYVAGGLYLRERGKTETDPVKAARYRGWGKSIVLQGAFLFAFDLTAYFILKSDNEFFRPIIEGISFSGNSLGWRMQF